MCKDFSVAYVNVFKYKYTTFIMANIMISDSGLKKTILAC